MATALCQLLDELMQDPNIFVIATANMTKKLPSHLLSRFAQGTFEIKEPSYKARTEFVEFFLAKYSCDYDKELVSFVADKTYNHSIRDIEGIISAAQGYYQCRLCEIQQHEKNIAKEDIERALDDLQTAMRKTGEFRLSPFQRKMKNWAEKISPYVNPSIALIGLGMTAYGLYKSDFFNGKQLANATQQMQATQQSLSMQRTSLELQTNGLEMQQQALAMQSKSLELQGESVELQSTALGLQIGQMAAPIVSDAIGIVISSCTIV
jgi:hypothetical protein